jgi:hypothetical protein
VSIDTDNLPSWNIQSLDIDTTIPANVAVLQDFAAAGVTIDNGSQNYLPSVSVSFEVINAHTGEVILDGRGSSDFDGSIISHAWTWPGGSASQANPTVILPSGDTTVTLTVTDNAGATSQLDVVVSFRSLAQLMSEAGLTGNDALPMAIPFNDGVPNLLKYAFNLNLAGRDHRTMVPGGTAGLPHVSRVAGESPVFRVEYLRRIGAGLSYLPQSSSSLDGNNWEPVTGTMQVTPVDTSWERVIHEIPATAERMFGRVGVELGL